MGQLNVSRHCSITSGTPLAISAVVCRRSFTSESGLAPGSNLTSSRTGVTKVSAQSCAYSCDNSQFMNRRAALGCGARANTADGPMHSSDPSVGYCTASGLPFDADSNVVASGPSPALHSPAFTNVIGSLPDRPMRGLFFASLSKYCQP